MGKYFSNDSEILNYDITDDLTVDMTNQSKIPTSVPQIQEPIDDSKKEFLSKPINSIDEKIEKIHEQNQEIKEQFSKIEKERVKQTFKSFDELEVLERLNQITFLLVQQNDRISNIEQFLKENFSSETQQEEINRMEQSNHIKPTEDLTPTQKHIQETLENEKVDYTNIQQVKKELGKIKSSKGSIPNEGYIDNSINLEETFPDRDPEAYQAAYQAMEEIRKKNPSVGYSKSPKGGFNGANAGF